MQTNSNKAGVVASFFVLAIVQLAFYTGLPEPIRNAIWPVSVMKNWHEYGFWHLGGQLVANPGGIEAGESQIIYPGHQPYFLILPFLLKELPGAAGGHGCLYDLCLLLATYAGVLTLFGANWRGILIAWVVGLSPGFVHNVAYIDSITTPAALGIAVMTFAGATFASKETAPVKKAAALAILLLFMLMNWSTLFSLFILAAYLWGKQPNYKAWAGYLSVALLVGLTILFVSLISRQNGNQMVTGVKEGGFVNTYLWGPRGYDGAGMTWIKAIVRLAGVNTICWLPLALTGLFIAAAAGFNRKASAFLPLLAGIFSLLAMRNYNAFHSWNAVSFVGLGLVFTIELLVANKASAGSEIRRLPGLATVVFCAFYFLTWQALGNNRSRSWNALHQFVVENTPRHGLVVLADILPANAPVNAKSYSVEFDRKTISLAEYQKESARLHEGGRQIFLLAHATMLTNATLISEIHYQPTWFDRQVGSRFDNYREKFSRRPKTSYMKCFDDYRLYKL